MPTGGVTKVAKSPATLVLVLTTSTWYDETQGAAENGVGTKLENSPAALALNPILSD